MILLLLLCILLCHRFDELAEIFEFFERWPKDWTFSYESIVLHCFVQLSRFLQHKVNFFFGFHIYFHQQLFNRFDNFPCSFLLVATWFLLQGIECHVSSFSFQKELAYRHNP